MQCFLFFLTALFVLGYPTINVTCRVLQGEIRGLERTRESMARELVSLSNQNTELEERLEEFPTLQARLQEVEGRYNALLQMYGEKVEEADELKMDLQDVKDMYKAQVTYP